MDLNVLGRAKNRFESLKARFNKRASVRTEDKPKTPETPKIQHFKSDWEAPEQIEELSFREMRSRAKMNATRNKRLAMKKFHRRQRKMNKLYRVSA